MATEDPMMASVAGRYASALFDLAKEQGKLAEVDQDLGKFQSLLGMSEDLQRMVKSPVLLADDQGKALAKVLEKAGVGPLVTGFLQLITRNRRLFAAGDMIGVFRALLARDRGEVAAEVTSAAPLSETQVAALKESLKASVGKDVTLDAKVDPSILGGLIVKVGSRMVDSSLKTKLANLKVSLAG